MLMSMVMVRMMFVPNFNNTNGIPAPVSVEVDLFDILSSSSTFSASAVGRIRFLFDPVDSFANFQTGWYVDTILVEGEGTLAGDSFAVGDDLTWTGTVVALAGYEGPLAAFIQVGGVPLVHSGSDARFGLLAGTFVGPNALLRFYVLHCVALPVVVTILLAVHFWRIRKDGGISGPL